MPTFLSCCRISFVILVFACTLTGSVLPGDLAQSGAATLIPAVSDKRPGQDRLKQFSTLLDSAEAKLAFTESRAKGSLDNDRLRELRQEILREVQGLAPIAEALQVEKSRITAEQNTLGPAPEDKSTETAPVGKLREALGKQMVLAEADIKTVQFLKVRAQVLTQRIIAIQRDRLADQLFSRNADPFAPETWGVALRDLTSQGSRTAEVIDFVRNVDWSSEATQLVVKKLIGTVLLGFVLVWPFRIWLNRRLLPVWDPSVRLGFSERLWISVKRGLIRMVPLAVLVGIANAVIQGAGILGDIGANALALISTILVSLVAVISLVRAVLSPGKPNWRAVPINDAAAARSCQIVTVLLVISSFDHFLAFGEQVWNLTVEVVSLRMFVTTLATMLPIFALTGARLWHQAPDGQLDYGKAAKTRWVRWPVSAVAAGASIAAVAGYTELGHSLATSLLRSSVVVLVSVAAFAVLRELLTLVLSRVGGPVREDRKQAENSDSGAMMRFWLSVVAALVVGVPAFLAFLLLWGVSRDTIDSGLSLLIDGFAIGSVHISLINVVTAILIFTGLLFVTKVIKAILEKRVLPMTRLDTGLQNSFATSVGYIGFVTALLAAASTLGIGLSNLAIVAGALSVGIGFGLQTIVNNFVSGLILLFERPIKVGDWIVTGDTEGYVRRIRVRATEIETFNRSTVIIPNSALITAPVTNWFLNDRVGRCIVEIGVGYDSDPEKVRSILLDCARSHPRVSRWPEPSALLVAFGDSALNFSLRFYLQDIELINPVGSEVRVAILKRFRKEGISIPFPQRDVHVIHKQSGMQAAEW
ncbi:mechanosensitive ion channel family protein [Haematospirillum sp. 15-248]|uniref:DUF3772 domain-containing protein n=1 Tax=Haematospirillum sp. 15-248 TaxID=2723107 RepID=UPI00143A6BF6|nr:DUF3772 domain-containing protein [Haematospirillum sp. 15-248]NKD88533.1 mechanosensitive ion channel family protein [Haematospirillum sp. 15-248]